MSSSSSSSSLASLELLAPAGGPAALTAALAAGANAVYFGLKQLNARRGAENFMPATLAATVAEIHQHKARAYLTLNIDLTQRELGQAARQLELARRSGIDAVLVRDPALLALKPLFPELEFHFSTQAGISSSAGMRAARELGITRVVLARELSLDEIRAASAVTGVETEVFIQGALCFSASGRCLISSWVGGRSGNRGACASPCRVAWSTNGQPAERPLSMHDLALLGRLPELQAAGVRALKIEGRLKTPEWVSRAVTLYRRALDGAAPAELVVEGQRLGQYTGRQLTAAYLDGRRQELTGISARPSGRPEPWRPTAESAEPEETAPAKPIGLTITVTSDPAGGLFWHLSYNRHEETVRTPPQNVRKPDRAVTLGEMRQRLLDEPLQGITPETITLPDPDLLLPRAAANNVVKALSAFLHRSGKEPDGLVRLDLPQDVREKLLPPPPCPENRRMLGDAPDRVRVPAADVGAVLATFPHLTVIADGASPEAVTRWVTSFGAARLVVALPAVFYEADIVSLNQLTAICRTHQVTMEINSWDGWELAKSCGVRSEAGPGLMLLNAMAAAELATLGITAVTASVEADREQLEDLSTVCPLPLSLYIYGRPALLQTRVELPHEFLGKIYTDARETAMIPRREGSLTVFRPVAPYSWLDLRNPQLRACHLVADLNGASPDPVTELRAILAGKPAGLRFNYDRTLR